MVLKCEYCLAIANQADIPGRLILAIFDYCERCFDMKYQFELMEVVMKRIFD